MPRPLALTTLLLLLGLALTGADTPTSETAEAVPLEGDWKARADKWFTTVSEKARKKEMRKATKALRKPCKHCHTPDWSGYTDRLDISRQMMALSAEHGVACKDCHAGKKNVLTELGEKAKPMWALSHEKKVFCEECHVPGKRFEVLTKAGKKHQSVTAKAKKKPEK